MLDIIQLHQINANGIWREQRYFQAKGDQFKERLNKFKTRYATHEITERIAE